MQPLLNADRPVEAKPPKLQPLALTRPVEPRTRLRSEPGSEPAAAAADTGEGAAAAAADARVVHETLERLAHSMVSRGQQVHRWLSLGLRVSGARPPWSAEGSSGPRCSR